MTMSININEAWQLLRDKVAACKNCELCAARKNTVFGEGITENCKLAIIGEAPGADEDEQGRPFVGKSGELLTAILERGARIPRKSVFITNVVKCRPPENRDPKQIEMLACNDFLEAQLLLLKPSIIITMGNIATRWLLKTDLGITRLRGRWQQWRSIEIMPMYHPSFLLRAYSDDSYKRQAWGDIMAVKRKLDTL